MKQQEKKSNIVVTGMGIVSPAGNTLETFWDTLCQGRSCIRPLTRFDTSQFTFKRGGEVREFSLPEHLAHFAKTEDLAVQFLLGAVDQAVQQAQLGSKKNIAVVVATNFAGSATAEKLYAQVFKAAPVQSRVWSAARFQRGADAVAEAWQLTGPRQTLSLSCSSGSAALVVGADLIRTGQADAVITAGFDAISRFAWLGLGALRTMTQDEVRPFDINRSGTLFSEGAGVIILEDAAAARTRQAAIVAAFAGGATNNNAFHITAPAKQGVGSADVMKAALIDAAMTADEVGHINMHGTGTQGNDGTETEAVKTAFGTRAKDIPATSIKSSLGHMLGAAGSAEAIASVLTLVHGMIPPTTHCQDQDPACDLDIVKNEARPTVATAVLSNSAGIGGCNAAVIFRKAERGEQEAESGKTRNEEPGTRNQGRETEGERPTSNVQHPTSNEDSAPGARRVVITGLGPVSPIGVGRDEFFEGLDIADDGIGSEGLPGEPSFADIAVGDVRDFDIKDYFGKPKGYLDRATQLAFAATVLALADAGLENDDLGGGRSGIALGTETGCLETAGKFYADFLKKGPRFVKPILFPHTYSNTTISMLAIEWGLQGPHLAFASGLNAGVQAIRAAADQIRQGRADIMLAGGVEALSREWLAGLQADGCLAPGGISAPLDEKSRGLVPGEGAGLLVLETYEHAMARGARIYGEVSCESPGPSPDAVLSGANGLPVVDNGTLEQLPDDCPVTAIKSMTGETGAAAAAFQVMAGLFAAETGVLPPTLNVQNPHTRIEKNLVVDMDVACTVRTFSVTSCDFSGIGEALLINASTPVDRKEK